MNIQTVHSDNVGTFIRSFNRDTVFVTTAARKIWTESDLEGAIAHEEAHIKHHHAEIKLFLEAALAIYQVERLIRGRGFVGRYLTARLVQFFVLNGYSYLIECIADNSAKEKGFGPQMASALSKVEVPRRTMIVGIMNGHLHPSRKSRIKRLTK